MRFLQVEKRREPPSGIVESGSAPSQIGPTIDLSCQGFKETLPELSRAWAACIRSRDRSSDTSSSRISLSLSRTLSMLSSCLLMATTVNKQPPRSLPAGAPSNVHFSRCPEGILAGIGPRTQMFQKQLVLERATVPLATTEMSRLPGPGLPRFWNRSAGLHFRRWRR